MLAGLSALRLHAQPQQPAAPYASLRYEENYAALRDPSRRTDALDKLKFIGLNRTRTAYLTLGGEARLRYQYFRHEAWGLTPYATTSSLEQRYLLLADVHLGRGLRIFGEVQSSQQNFRPGGPAALEEDKLDLHQAFVEVMLPLADSASLTLRPGRQELYYGSGKLVAPREALNTRLSFDAARLLLRVRQWRVDAFVAQPVLNKPGFWDNQRNRQQTFWGLYATGTVRAARLPRATLDGYYLGIRNERQLYDQGSGREVRHTLGFRLAGRAGAVDYSLESQGQVGTFAGARSWAGGLTSGLGYTWRRGPRSLRTSLGGGVSSGDHDPRNPTLGTFNPLYPTGYYFGPPAAPIGAANLLTLWPGLTGKPAPQVTLALEAALLWRQSAQDGLYTPGVALLLPRSTSPARYIGTLYSLAATWQVQRHLALVLWAAYFPPGDYLRATTPGQAISYVLPTVTFRF